MSYGETDSIGDIVNEPSAVMPELEEAEDSCATTVYDPLATSGSVKEEPEGMLPEDVAVNVPRSVEKMEDPWGPARYTEIEDEGSHPEPATVPVVVGCVPVTDIDGFRVLTVICDADANSAPDEVADEESLAMM